MGRGAKPPPQLGQTSSRTDPTHSAQKVHSKLQIRASSDAGGSGREQFSQVGRSSSMSRKYAERRARARTRDATDQDLGAAPRAQSMRITTFPKWAPLCR